MFLARMITRSKWQAREGFAADEIPADAITADLRTAGNALSFWQCGEATDKEVLDVVLAIAAGRDRVQKLDIVWIVEEELVRDGLETRPSRGRTPIARQVERHVDICHLDYGRLGKIGEQVALAIRKDRWKRFRQQQILTLLVAAVGDGRVSLSDLAIKPRAEVQAKLGS